MSVQGNLFPPRDSLVVRWHELELQQQRLILIGEEATREEWARWYLDAASLYAAKAARSLPAAHNYVSSDYGIPMEDGSVRRASITVQYVDGMTPTEHAHKALAEVSRLRVALAQIAGGSSEAALIAKRALEERALEEPEKAG